MVIFQRSRLILLIGTLITTGCIEPRTPPAECTQRLETSSNDQTNIQEALIDATEGDILCFDDGTYRFTDELSLSVSGVKLRGTFLGAVLDFTNQVVGGNGVSVTGDDFIIQDLTVRNTPGDGVRVTNATNVTFQNLTVSWDGEPNITNGGYGIYPVGCTNVLVENSEAYGASDAGIYVGQSNNVIVRNNKAHGNVAGIEIENTVGADVYENHAYDNAGGILVFDLPNLPQKNGQIAKVHHNLIENNNRDNFAPDGNIVATVPKGTGILLLAANNTEIHDNTIEDNISTGIAIASYLALAIPIDDTEYDPWAETTYIHDNTFKNNGTNAQGILAGISAMAYGGLTLPDIVFDGFVDTSKDNSDNSLSHCIQNNGEATFANVDLPNDCTGVSEDLTPHDCSHAALPTVEL